MPAYWSRSGNRNSTPRKIGSAGISYAPDRTSSSSNSQPVQQPKKIIEDRGTELVTITTDSTGRTTTLHEPKGFSGAPVSQVQTSSKTAQYTGSKDPQSQQIFRTNQAKKVMSARAYEEGSKLSIPENKDISTKQGMTAGEALAVIKADVNARGNVRREDIARAVMRTQTDEGTKRKISLATGVSRGVQPTTYEEYKIERGEREYAQRRAKSRSVKELASISRATPSDYYTLIPASQETIQRRSTGGYSYEELQIPKRTAAEFAESRKVKPEPAIKTYSSFEAARDIKPYADKIISKVVSAGRKKAEAYDTAYRTIKTQFPNAFHTPKAGSAQDTFQTTLGIKDKPFTSSYDFALPRNTEEIAGMVLTGEAIKYGSRGVRWAWKNREEIWQAAKTVKLSTGNPLDFYAYKGRRATKAAMRKKTYGQFSQPKVGTPRAIKDVVLYKDRQPVVARLFVQRLPKKQGSLTYAVGQNLATGDRIIEVAPTKFTVRSKGRTMRSQGIEATIGGNPPPQPKVIKAKILSSSATSSPPQMNGFLKQLQKAGVTKKEYKQRLRALRSEQVRQSNARPGFRPGMYEKLQTKFQGLKQKRYALQTVKMAGGVRARKKQYNFRYRADLSYSGSSQASFPSYDQASQSSIGTGYFSRKNLGGPKKKYRLPFVNEESYIPARRINPETGLVRVERGNFALANRPASRQFPLFRPGSKPKLGLGEGVKYGPAFNLGQNNKLSQNLGLNQAQIQKLSQRQTLRQSHALKMSNINKLTSSQRTKRTVRQQKTRQPTTREFMTVERIAKKQTVKERGDFDYYRTQHVRTSPKPKNPFGRLPLLPMNRKKEQSRKRGKSYYETVYGFRRFKL